MVLLSQHRRGRNKMGGLSIFWTVTVIVVVGLAMIAPIFAMD